MDKNTWIGFLLIAAIIVGFSLINRPSKEELAERQRINDSIALAHQQEYEAQRLSDSISAQLFTQAESIQEATTPAQSEAELQSRLAAAYGPFAPSARGAKSYVVLENEKLRISVSTRGGRIARAELKEFKAYGDSIHDLCLFDEDEAETAFTLITNNQRIISTKNLYFEPVEVSDSTVTLRLMTTNEDAWLDFNYRLQGDDYMVRFEVVPHNTALVMAQNINSLEMQWHQLIAQQERGRKFEERYAQLQYMLVGGDMEKLSEQKADTKKESARIKWIGYKDQFFSTVMIADEDFGGASFTSTPMREASGYIKEYTTETSIAFDVAGNKSTGFTYFFGPNNFRLLKAYDKDKASADKLHLQELVPLGWKVVSWINKILLIPMFDLFSSWGMHVGWVIFLMTIVIRLVILPFTFQSYRSSAKMRVLKPQMDAINEKYPPEKMEERQKATMALYQRAGVSPMSGCLPMLFQFPILMAAFWFFPTAIELRGQSLWWAEDLSTYDAILTWGTSIPLFGNHLSLFCLLMTVANFGYTFITMQQQNTGNDPASKMMKWMMYLMPLMFLFIFNDYAAGLSFYYLCSLLMSVFQTMLFRWTLNDERVLKEMERNAKKKDAKPKKSGFMERLEKMQREAQQQAREQAKAQQKKYH